MRHDTPGPAKYIARVSHIARLDRETERELLRRYKDTGDRKAADRLLEAHLPFVVAMATRYRGYNVPICDLISEGNFALIEALDRFDVDRDLRFVTYAAFWVRARLVGLVLRNYSVARGGRTVLKSRIFFKLRREHAKSLTRFGDSELALLQVSQSLSMPVEKVRELLRQVENTDLSMDSTPCPEGKSLLETMSDDRPSQESQVSRHEQEYLLRTVVAQALARLDQRERHIAEARMLADSESEVTLADLGREMGISRERVRQLEDRARHKLRAFVTDIGEKIGYDAREALSAA